MILTILLSIVAVIAVLFFAFWFYFRMPPFDLYFRGVFYPLLFISGTWLIFPLLVLLYPIRLVMDPYWTWGSFLLHGWCSFALRTFGVKLIVEGLENLPSYKDFKRIIIVSNHQTLIDAAAIPSVLQRRFYPTFKSDLLYIPFVGLSMALAGSVPVTRTSKESGRHMREEVGRRMKKSGDSFLFFAEGTRRGSMVTREEPLGEFKAGAFKVAITEQANILPMTISGASTLYQTPGGAPRMGYTDIQITFHPIIRVAGKSIEELDALSNECKTVIAKGLRDVDFLPPAEPHR